MSDAQAQSSTTADTGPLPDIRVRSARTNADFATILGVIFAVRLIAGAIAIGESHANFLNVPALMIVLLGTFAATAISFTSAEFIRAGHVIGKSLFRQVYDPARMARTLLDLAMVAKKRGILALSGFEPEMRKVPFLAKYLQLVVDGYAAKKVEAVLSQEIEAQIERHKRSAGITRRAAEVAPAMGLIGTLVGLVQMLAELENPEAIGPAMAVALLTTFYGAILGTVIMAPLASKLAVSIASQENPRQLEMELNAALPPSKRIQYFD